MSDLLQLSPVECRVLGVLIEKEATTPDAYPLTLNALVTGCNQKTSRDPVLTLSDTEVQAALDALRGHTLVTESSGGRTWRYAHNAAKGLRLNSGEIALVAMLWLRGPQTPGELRIHCERLYKFADVGALEGYLERLALREPPAVVQLARQHGARESRWAHCYSGTPAEPVFESAAPAPSGGARADRLAELEARVAQLERAVSDLCAQLGIAGD
ncbi:MAG: YceH family protein [Rhodocyclaceae bacterium]|nr:YceH family protein [Rhodocyclaceae bacterium]MBX3667828.1 YceH family protein [Rhodocyclaceae bacterium]